MMGKAGGRKMSRGYIFKKRRPRTVGNIVVIVVVEIDGVAYNEINRRITD